MDLRFSCLMRLERINSLFRLGLVKLKYCGNGDIIEFLSRTNYLRALVLRHRAAHGTVPKYDVRCALADRTCARVPAYRGLLCMCVCACVL